MTPGRADTPCIGICRLDASGRVCTGCLRTLDEIANWSQYIDAERSRVTRELRLRRAARPADPA
jgi:predicted Fe-S protein YdhL (DUF1289 family)